MSRAKAILQSEFPYNISARCINHEWFNLPMDGVWKVFSEELEKSITEFNLVVHSFVLMSNHFHLIASTPHANISQCMQNFMGKTSRRLTGLGNRINETFAGRHYKCILQQQNFYMSAYKYNYRNPVAAGICARVEDYPYSTLQFLIEPNKKTFPLADDTTFKSDPAGVLEWLNTPSNPELVEAFRTAVRHPYFKSKREWMPVMNNQSFL